MSEVYPVKPGDWVAYRGNDRRFGRVKDVMIDRDETVIHVVLYQHTGEKIGRESPIEGGPRSFEPCCSYTSWYRIDKPDFPVTLKWIDNGDGTRTARYYSGPQLPDRKWVRPVRRQSGMANLDLKSEIAALLRAAQELRDAARRLKVPELVDRAIILEREAASLRKAL